MNNYDTEISLQEALDNCGKAFQEFADTIAKLCDHSNQLNQTLSESIQVQEEILNANSAN